MMITGCIVFIFGLLMGSFLNLCIERIPEGEFDLFSSPASPEYKSGKSRLKSMGLTLGGYLLCGKSGHCDQKISVKFLFVELLTGIVLVSLFIKYGLTVDFGALSLLMFILIIVFFIDLKHQIIPNELVIAGLSGGAVLFIYNLFLPLKIYSDRLWWNPLLGLVSGSGFLLGVAVIGSLLYHHQEVMGMGDVKLLAPIGLFLGWRMTLLALYISVILGGITSLILIFSGKANRKSMIPFGPYIVAGVFVTVMWGWDIVRWYLNTFF